MTLTRTSNRPATASFFAALPLAMGLLLSSACSVDVQEPVGEPVAEATAASTTVCEDAITAEERAEVFGVLVEAGVEIDEETSSLLEAAMDAHNDRACEEGFDSMTAITNQFPMVGPATCFALKRLFSELDLAWLAARAGRDAAPDELLPYFAALETEIANAQRNVEDLWSRYGCAKMFGSIY